MSKYGTSSVARLLSQRANVIYALMLRDMRTRFGRSHISYLIAIAWPIIHLLVLVVIMAFVNRIAPIGGDPVVFVTSGVLAYILCFYPARAMGMALEMNRALFLFPVVKVIDVIVSRAIVEFVTSFIVVSVVFLTAGIAGIDLVPLDRFTLASGIVAIIFFSLSLGVVNVVLASIFRMWNIVFIFMMLGMYMTSGLFAVPSAMPQAMKDIVWFNPLLHAVEWIRSAYYEGYGDDMLSKTYFVSLGTIFLLFGLLGERYMRGKLLTG